MGDLIDLQHAHVTQYTGPSGKSGWKVRKNITSEDLFELPGHLSEKDVFTILEFARKFELIALNMGIQNGKKRTVSLYDGVINQLQDRLKRATNENERLASVLEKHIGKGE